MSNSNLSCCAQGRADYPSAATGTVATTCGVEPSPTVIPRRWSPPIGGTFLMGSEDRRFPGDGEGPVREVIVSEFVIACFAVSNLQFGDFVRATGYTTDAERYGWSFVFAGLLADDVKREINSRVADTPWWVPVSHAYWAQPEGAPSTILDRLDHPVVHVSWNDAKAYCDWSATRLPTEAEWEMAARGGLKQATYPWGDHLTPEGEHRCNIWQGDFPIHNTIGDGYAGTAPVHTFPANGFGLHNATTFGNGARITSRLDIIR